MPQFFINNDDIDNGTATIRGGDSYHLARVRRVKPGVKILLRTGDGKGYMAKVISVSPDAVRAEITGEVQRDSTLPDITLYAALLKGGNFDFVIQKTVELGVGRVVPVITERTVPDPGKMNDRKLERWEKIASEAAKQCLRTTPAFVEPPVAFKEILNDELPGLKIICHPGADTSMKDVLVSSQDKKNISLLIGPEGGFSDSEVNDARKAGWVAVNFGATHLRAETAAVVLPSIVIYEWS